MALTKKQKQSLARAAGKLIGAFIKGGGKNRRDDSGRTSGIPQQQPAPKKDKSCTPCG